jgi:hypothetical protein
MGRPRFLADNVFSKKIYPNHVLDASDTASNKSVLELGSGRRDRELTGWFASSLNAIGYVECVCDEARAFDLLWIDYDHNLDGESVSVIISDDDFATTQTIGPLVVPSTPTPNARLAENRIVRCNDGSLLWYLGLHVAHDVRVSVAAMGTGLRPEIAGLMLGLSFSPAHQAQKPYAFPRPTIVRGETRTAHAQAVGSEFGRYRTASHELLMSSYEEAEVGYYTLEDLYVDGGLGMVVVTDDERAERAVFSFCPDGMHGFETSGDWSYPRITVAVAESEPAL